MKRVLIVADHELTPVDRYHIVNGIRLPRADEYEIDVYWREERRAVCEEEDPWELWWYENYKMGVVGGPNEVDGPVDTDHWLDGYTGKRRV